jgi:hypothetical protein
MKTNWEIFEKTMSVIQILLGVTIAYILFSALYTSTSNILEHFNYTWKDISIQKLIIKHHFFTLLGLIGIIGGIKWFKFKTTGWLMSFMFWFLIGFSTILLTLKFKDKEPNVIRNIEEYLISYSIILVSFIIAFILGSKTFWTKYNPDKKSLIITGILLLFFVINRIILT